MFIAKVYKSPVVVEPIQVAVKGIVNESDGEIVRFAHDYMKESLWNWRMNRVSADWAIITIYRD